MKDRNTAIALGVALLFIGVSLYFTNVGTQTDKNSQESTAAKSDYADVPLRDSPTLGKEDAKVTIVEFADFQCPPCATFHFGAGAVLFDQYIKKGVAKLVYKHFPMLGEESFSAAYASECANEQGKFWEYHDYLFEQQSKAGAENGGTFSLPYLAGYAKQLGLNEDMFKACLDSEKYKDRISRDIADGKNAHVTGTPTIFINGKKVEGAATFKDYQQIIGGVK